MVQTQIFKISYLEKFGHKHTLDKRYFGSVEVLTDVLYFGSVYVLFFKQCETKIHFGSLDILTDMLYFGSVEV